MPSSNQMEGEDLRIPSSFRASGGTRVSKSEIEESILAINHQIIKIIEDSTTREFKCDCRQFYASTKCKLSVVSLVYPSSLTGHAGKPPASGHFHLTLPINLAAASLDFSPTSSLPPRLGSAVRVQGDEFWHMTKVLRLNTDDRIELFNGKGGLVEGCIESIDRTGADIVALENPKLVSTNATQWHVFAAFGSLKGGRSDWLIEKCTELGASSVTPLLTEHSPSIFENRMDRLQRVILAAAKQCQRLHEMALNPPLNVRGLLPIVSQTKQSFIAAAEATPVMNALAHSQREPVGSIIIGPEGG
ncbi:hypothetical protein E3N88_27828 [Mikania micrantha]|uniref:16S rRNA (uracil(1498)-N(3))-methyltransferase n=1 Tax=Mikania micrantha TaxID=192012 RepID=A0A5N6MYW7_9ASTR|nr:hypothetical protein E3N88_27828 [Mikania micrantha]